MRVIAGSHRGRRLCGPQGTTLRPTSDMVREALFSILGARVPGSRFLDLYAGTGAVGIEAFSRGADVVTFVESDLKAAQLMRKNLTTCHLLDRADIRLATAKSFLQRSDWWKGPYDLLFADPPYGDSDQEELIRAAWQPGLLRDRALVVLEQDSRSELPALIDHAKLIRRYVYGDTALFVYGSSPTEVVTS
ncbi:MAG TPA: 16S rRNA (guanine(966)-N(2))-methyltransferase RsmD [Nitrospira sp.]|nr:16S rRNA (guanine(966)-N(2))-methyltransferase RsmD [Nitrospira sp.]